MASANNNAYVHGAAITAALMTQSIQGTFACDNGYALNTAVTFVCGWANRAATLSAQPCILACDTVADYDTTAAVVGNAAVSTLRLCSQSPTPTTPPPWRPPATTPMCTGSPSLPRS